MIIGIDESGDFESDGTSMYASVLIRPKKYDKIGLVFESWEASLPDSVKKNGEVKGYLLSQDQLLDFVDKILRNNGYGKIEHHVYGIMLNSETKKSLHDERLRNVRQYRDAVKMYQSQGEKFKVIAHQYGQLADWLESKGIKSLAKIKLLGYMIVKSINLSIISSVYRNFDRELGQLDIKIDEGLIAKETAKLFWLDIMRNTFWSASKENPMILIDSWKPSHPFLKRFVNDPKSKDVVGTYTPEIRKVMNFYSSHSNYEIRIADIIVSTYYRHFIEKQKLDEVIDSLKGLKVLQPAPYTVLVPSGKPDPNPINPYDILAAAD